ncbi:MAG: porin [Thioalkalivibrionaceae bacterium]
MKKQLLASSIAALVAAAPLVASAETTLYGNFQYEIGFLDDGDDRLVTQSYGDTYVGITGGEDLGGGASAFFTVEMDVIPNGGTETSILIAGLEGGFGSLTVGLDDNAFGLNYDHFDIFDGLAADSLEPLSEGSVSGLLYTTPSFGGFQAMLSVMNDDLSGANKDYDVSLGLMYELGPVLLNAGLEYIDGEDATNYQVGAMYAAGDLSVGLLYQSFDKIADVFIAPLTYDFGRVGLKAAVRYIDFDGGSDATEFGLEAAYNFSGRTAAFASVFTEDKNRTLAGKDLTQFTVGVRHAF